MNTIRNFNFVTPIFLIIVLFLPMLQSCQKDELINGPSHPWSYSSSVTVNNTTYNTGDTITINGDLYQYNGDYTWSPVNNTTNNYSLVYNPVTNNFVTTNVVNNFNNVNVNNTTNYYNTVNNCLYQYSYTFNNQMYFTVTNVTNNTTTTNIWNSTTNTWNTVIVKNYNYLCPGCHCDTTLVTPIDTVYIFQNDTIIKHDTILQIAPSTIKMMAFAPGEIVWIVKNICGETVREHFSGGEDSIRTVFQLAPNSVSFATFEPVSGLLGAAGQEYIKYKLHCRQAEQTLYADLSYWSLTGWKLDDPMSTCQGMNSMPGDVIGKSFPFTPTGNLPGVYGWPASANLRVGDGNQPGTISNNVVVLGSGYAAFNAAMQGFPLKAVTWLPVPIKTASGQDAVYRDYGVAEGQPGAWKKVADYQYPYN